MMYPLQDPPSATFRRLIFSVYVVLVSASMASASEYNLGKDGFMLHGMDAVAYVDLDQTIEGENAFVDQYMGAKYRFANAKNLAAFEADPERYAPAYGGWCAYGVRVGKKFDVDPSVYKVVDGRLYLQLDQGTQKIWVGDLQRNISIADRLWPRLKDVSPEMLDQ